MLNRGLSQIGLRILDKATDISPRVAPRLFERGLVGIFGSRPVASFVIGKHRRHWEKIAVTMESTSKILFVVDVCIGDAVLASECLRSIQAARPNAEVHCVCNGTGGELVRGMPGVRVHNFVKGERGFPTGSDLDRLRQLIAEESFAAVLNMGPFLDARQLPAKTRVVQLYVPFAAYMLRAWKAKGRRHISYFAREFVSEFLAGRAKKFEERNFAEPAIQLNANTVYLSSGSVERAKTFLESHGLAPGRGLVFFNPDATSQYGQIPFEIQARLLKHIAGLEEVRAILLGKAYSNQGIEARLMAELEKMGDHSPLARKVVIVPHVPIEAYTALIDASDMFISGDTGPLHISACRKIMVNRTGSTPMRNQTAVLAIYGATDSRMYGYDSVQPHHVPANQDVPSRSFSAPAVCRNISCINKFGKSCSEVRCFDGLPEAEIAQYISAYFTKRTADRSPDRSSKGRLAHERPPNERSPQDRSPYEQPPITIALTPEREYAF